ncbi:MAG TPA: hypothetical protein VHB97_18745 [Polyangia bacterium]|nr:hypothetical protein [Polyangia bacterium]
MSRTKTLLWWISATVVAMVAVAEVGMHMGAARAMRRNSAPAVAITDPCRTRRLDVDVDGDGTPESVRLVRVGDEAWADVWSGAAMRSSTRLGAWRDDAVIEALDVNGDGNVDIVRHWSEGLQAYAQVWLSDGNAFDEGWSGVTGDRCIAENDVAAR